QGGGAGSWHRPAPTLGQPRHRDGTASRAHGWRTPWAAFLLGRKSWPATPRRRAWRGAGGAAAAVLSAGAGAVTPADLQVLRWVGQVARSQKHASAAQAATVGSVIQCWVPADAHRPGRRGRRSRGGPTPPGRRRL